MITFAWLVFAVWLVSAKVLALICVSYSSSSGIADINRAMSSIYRCIKTRSPAYGLSNTALRRITPVYWLYISAAWTLVAALLICVSQWLMKRGF